MYCVLTKCHSNFPAFTLFTCLKELFTELIQHEAWEEILGMFFFKFCNLSSTQIFIYVKRRRRRQSRDASLLQMSAERMSRNYLQSRPAGKRVC